MALLQVNIPDELKAQFEQTFPGQDINGLIGRLMRDALEQNNLNQREKRSKAVEELLALRKETPPVSSKEIQKARELGHP